MTRSLLAAIFSLLWLIVIPIGVVIASQLMQPIWILEATHRPYSWIVGGAVIWLFGVPFVLVPENTTGLAYAGLAAWAILCGATAGLVAVSIVNSVWDSSPGEVVGVEATEYTKGRVRFQVSEGPHKGVEFAVANSKWGHFDGKRRTFVMHRGRIGLWWGRLL